MKSRRTVKTKLRRPRSLVKARKERVAENRLAQLYPNRFYVGADSALVVRYGGVDGMWAKPTFEDAVQHANRILDESPQRKSAFIVQIIAVVRRKPVPVHLSPIIVEKL